MTLLSPGTDPVAEARAFGIAIALLIMAGEFTFRSRDPSLALSGSADSQIVIELAISAAVGGWLLARRLMVHLAPGRSLLAFRRVPPGSPLRVMRFIAIFAVISSFWSTTSIAPVRAIQLVIVVELFADASMSLNGNRRALRAFFASLAVTMIIGVSLAALITAGYPGFNPFYPTYNGPSRLRLLSMHPIATADLLGFVALLMIAPLWRLDVPDNPADRTGGRTFPVWLRVLGVAGITTAIVLSLERSSTAAGLLAMATLLMLNTSWYRVRLFLLAFASAGLIVATLVGSVITSFASRGETSTGITSLSGRSQIFDLATHLFWLRPYTGWGYNAGRSIFLPTIPWAGESHNVVVEIVVSAGLVGVVSYAVLFHRWYRQVAIALRAGDAARRIATLSTALIVLIGVIGVGSDSFAGPPKLLVISLALAMMLSDAAISVRTPEPAPARQVHRIRPPADRARSVVAG